jgi:hypothetical protein
VDGGRHSSTGSGRSLTRADGDSESQTASCDEPWEVAYADADVDACEAALSAALALPNWVWYHQGMSHPYDASTKYLVDARLADWLPLCGRATAAPAEVINADVGTVTAAADRVLRIFEDPAWLMHVELQASRGDLLLPNPAHCGRPPTC